MLHTQLCAEKGMGVIGKSNPPQASSGRASGKDGLQHVEEARISVFHDGEGVTAYVGGIKNKIWCF